MDKKMKAIIFSGAAVLVCANIVALFLLSGKRQTVVVVEKIVSSKESVGENQSEELIPVIGHEDTKRVIRSEPEGTVRTQQPVKIESVPANKETAYKSPSSNKSGSSSRVRTKYSPEGSGLEKAMVEPELPRQNYEPEQEKVYVTSEEIKDAFKKVFSSKNEEESSAEFETIYRSMTVETSREMNNYVKQMPPESREYKQFYKKWGEISGQEAVEKGDPGVAIEGWAKTGTRESCRVG